MLLLPARRGGARLDARWSCTCCQYKTRDLADLQGFEVVWQNKKFSCIRLEIKTTGMGRHTGGKDQVQGSIPGIIVVHSISHCPGLLGRGTVVKVYEGLVTYVLVENGEILSNFVPGLSYCWRGRRSFQLLKQNVE